MLMNDYSSHIGIIGGGIAGLTVACALKLRGINSVVFERDKKLSEYGAGISISPNALGPLERLGLRNDLVNRSFKAKKYTLHYKRKEIYSTKNQVVTSSRQTLIRILYQKFIDLGGKVLFDHEYKKVRQGSCEITFKNGEVYKVSHILACDGIKSSIRECHTSSSGKPPIYSGYSAWRGIGISDLKNIQLHFGPGTHLVSYPIDLKGKTSFVGVLKEKNVTDESWRVRGSKKALLEDFKFFNEDIFSVINSSQELYKWGIYIRPPLNSIYSDNITLLGDAAHPMVPFLGQGGCMAIEDAYTFATLANKLDCDFKKIQILYERIRLNRNNQVQSASLKQGKLNHIKNPLAALIRNLIISYTPLVRLRLGMVWDYDIEEEVLKALS